MKRNKPKFIRIFNGVMTSLVNSLLKLFLALFVASLVLYMAVNTKVQYDVTTALSEAVRAVNSSSFIKKTVSTGKNIFKVVKLLK